MSALFTALKESESRESLAVQVCQLRGALHMSVALLEAQLKVILDCNCVMDAQGEPDRSTLDAYAREHVEVFDAVIATVRDALGMQVQA